MSRVIVQNVRHKMLFRPVNLLQKRHMRIHQFTFTIRAQAHWMTS